MRTIAKVPLRKGEVDQDFDQEELAKLLDQTPFNVAIADLYRVALPPRARRRLHRPASSTRTTSPRPSRTPASTPEAVSGETPKRELAEILAGFERGEVDVLCNAMLLAEGWNSPRATICMHLAPTASRRVYQQRVGRVTRRNPGKEAGLVIDFVHPATTHDETIVTLHSLLDRDVYRGGAIVVGPVRRGRGRRVRVEKRIVPVSDDPERRLRVLERELWRIAVENLDPDEQHVWAALAGARVSPNGWRRAKAMLQHDQAASCAAASCSPACSATATRSCDQGAGEIAVRRDAEGLRRRDRHRRHLVARGAPRGRAVLLQALAERRIGRRDQAQAWVWRLAEYTREVHEEYAVQRWPETKRLLGLLVNSSGRAHGRNARRLVHAARNQDRPPGGGAAGRGGRAHARRARRCCAAPACAMARKPSARGARAAAQLPQGQAPRKQRKRRAGRGRGGRNGRNGAEAAAPGDAELEELEARTEPAPEAEPDERGRRGAGGGEATAAERLEVDLAGAEPHSLAPRRCTTSVPVVVDPARLARRPPSFQAMRRPEERRARGRRQDRVRGLEASSQRAERSSSARARSRGPPEPPSRSAQRGRGPRSSRGSSSAASADVEPDADHRPALVGAGLDQDPATLRPRSRRRSAT